MANKPKDDDESMAVQAVVERAAELGVSPETAEEIASEAAAEGVASDKLEEVVEEAIQVEREDLEDPEGSSGDVP